MMKGRNHLFHKTRFFKGAPDRITLTQKIEGFFEDLLFSSSTFEGKEAKKIRFNEQNGLGQWSQKKSQNKEFYYE